MRKLVLAVAHAKRAFFSSRGEAALCAALVLGMALGSRAAEAAPFAYVTNFNSHNVSVIDTATNTVVGSPIAVGAFPRGVAVTPEGTKVYVTNSDDNTVSVIATASNAVVANVMPKLFMCPSARRASNEGGTIINKDYGINGGTNSTCCPERTQAGQDGVAFMNSRIRLTDIKDGDSNTFLFIELVNWTNHSWIPYDYGSNGFIWVHHPSQGYVCYDGYPPNPPVVNGADFNNRAPASDHSGGLNAAKCDGSVFWVPNSIPQTTVYKAMFTRNAGEVILGW